MQTDLAPTTAPVVLAPGEGHALWVAGTRHIHKVGADQTGGAFALLETVVPPEGGPPPHIHERETEAFYVLDGQFAFLIGQGTVVVEAGGFVLVPPGTPHTFRNVGERDGRLLTVITPGGFERYFETVGTPIVAGEPAPAVDERAVQQMLAHAPAFGLSFLPPQD